MNFEYTKATDLIFKSQVNPLTGQPFSNRYYSILEDRKKLPVMEFLDTLEEAMEKNQVVIVEGETGSGKTTQVPKVSSMEACVIAQALVLHYLATHPGSDKIVGCTQPRRVAALNVAKRVADEMDVEVSKEIGYTIRFEDSRRSARN